MAEVLNLLGQTVIPQIFSSLQGAGLGELVDILTATETKDSAGAKITTWSASESDIKVPPIIPKNFSYKSMASGEWHTVQGYRVILPTTVEVNNFDRIRVQARGTRPERLIYIKSIGDKAGVVFEVNCTEEE